MTLLYLPDVKKYFKFEENMKKSLLVFRMFECYVKHLLKALQIQLFSLAEMRAGLKYKNSKIVAGLKYSLKIETQNESIRVSRLEKEIVKFVPNFSIKIASVNK